MKLAFLTQILDAMKEVMENDPDDYRNDFDTDPGEVEDPMGGDQGVTDYDKNNLDPDYE